MPTYYEQIRGLRPAVREYGLSVIMRGETAQAVTYAGLREKKASRPMPACWMRISGWHQPTAGYSHFLMLMEHIRL